MDVRTLPNKDEFKKFVETLEIESGITDCIYMKCIDEFTNIDLKDVNTQHEIRILRPFLLVWGNMGRVLGFAGIKRIRESLNDMSERFEPLRNNNILSIDLTTIKKFVITMFNEIREANFQSKKGKKKRVGPTAASKVLRARV
jgi:hypothetical protein